MNASEERDRKLREQLLLSRRVEGDRLMLDDAVLLAALDGSRALTVNEKAALSQSPLTLRRFRRLALERQRAPSASNDAWFGSVGMLRAASGGVLTSLRTDDGFWKLHFVEHGQGWNVILAMDASAPFAARLLRERPPLKVLDATGAQVLQGLLDSDGELECPWPFADEPASYFQAHGAAFKIEPVH